MRVYLAAPWVRKSEAVEAAKLITAAGHVITEPWWNHGDEKDPVKLQQEAELDVQGVLTADAVVVLNLEKSEGKAVEQGMALIAGLPIIGVGQRSNLFHYLSAYTWVSSVEEAINELHNQGQR